MGPVIASGNASGNGRETLNKPHRQSSISIEPGNSGFSTADGCAEVSVILSMPSLRLAAAVLRQLDLPADQLPNRRESVNLGQGKVVSLVRRLSEFTNWARHRSFLLGARRAKLVSG